MSEIIFGTPEHVAGLSRKALEEDFQWVNDRRMELEGECERLDAENAKLRELVLYAYECAIHSDHATCDDCRRMNGYCILERRMRELEIEVD